MADEIIDFYKKARESEEPQKPIEEQKETPVPEIPKPDEPFDRFLLELTEKLQKEKVITEKQQETFVEQIREPVSTDPNENDPFKRFIGSFANILKEDKLVNREENIKEATINFINKLKERPEEPFIIKDEVTVKPKQKKYLPPKIAKKVQKLPQPVVAEQADELIKEEPKEENTYVKELKTTDKTNKKTPEKIKSVSDIKSIVEKQVAEILSRYPNLGFTGGGGGTNAVQYVKGGTMDGDLNVTGKFLSGGVDISVLFGSGSGAISGIPDRLIAGSENLRLYSNGTIDFPGDTIRPPDEAILTLESENPALSAFTRVALSPYAFFAYDSNSNSITFDSVDNTITLTSKDQYEWSFNDRGELIGPDNVLTINSTLSTLGKILSGGRDLADIFTGGGGSGTANITVSSTPPIGVTEGHLWWSNDEGQLYIYYDDQWVQAAESVLAQENIPTDLSDLTDTTNLLFSGDYNDLTNTPSIPSALTDLGITDGANGQVLTTDGAGNFSFANSTGGITDIVNDSTPQLGGNLDLNSRNITGTGSILTTGDIQITGNVTAGGNIISSQVAPSNGDLILRSSHAGTANGAKITLDGDNLNANITLDPLGSGIVDVQGGLTATGDVTGYAFNGRIGSVTGTTVNQAFYPVFVSSIQPDQYLEAHSGLSYNPNSGILAATRFNGGFAGTLAADLNAQSFAKIINLPTPTNPGDAASKNYVDNQVAGITGFATESYVNTYVNARTQDLADNRGVWVRNANFDHTTGDFNQVIPWDAALVTSTIPNFTMSSGVFTNTDSRTRRFLFQMHVAIRTLVTDFTEADIWFSYNGTYSGSNRRGQVNATDVDGMPNVMLATSWTFTLAQNETVRCYVWAQQTYRIGGSAFGNDRSCLVEVQELN